MEVAKIRVTLAEGMKGKKVQGSVGHKDQVFGAEALA
jgi:hypothetical protein